MSKTVTLRLDDETYELFRKAADAEHRPLSNLIERAAMDRLREEQFVDEAEMAGIRGDESLLKHLKKGSRDARARRGKFVG